jgi:hypothetical protein
MAEREGFEPSRGIAPPYRFSKPTPSASWVPLLDWLIITILAEGVGFEPTDPCGSPVFKTGALDQLCDPSRTEEIISCQRSLADLI